MRFLPQVLIVEDEQAPGALLSLLPETTPQGDVIAYHTPDADDDLQEILQVHRIDVILVDARRCAEATTRLASVDTRAGGAELLCWVDTLAALGAAVMPKDAMTLLWQAEDVPRRLQTALQQRRLLIENQRLHAYYTAADRQVEALRRSLALQLQQRTHDLQQANDRLSQLTVTDDVTGLYNQRFLHKRLDEEFFRARRYHEALAVMMIDIDDFKQVNDKHDHLYGTRVLRRVGGVLRRTVRETDMVIRYGGDEFVIILPHTKLADAKVVAERLRHALQTRNVGTDQQPCRLTVSIGIAARDALHAACGRDILVAADRGLYRAKATGRNCVVAARSHLSAPRSGHARRDHAVSEAGVLAIMA